MERVADTEAGTVTGPKLGITLVAMIGALMAILDISIVNVALSDIRASFGTPLDQIAWVSTGYMMANVVVIPMTGWLQRRFGYRRYLAGSLLLFAAASALCAASVDLPSLVAFRVLQGIGGGAIIPTAHGLLLARYPREQHGLAGALFGLGALTGPLLGPTVGGYLIDWASWGWIFLVNVPLGLLAAGLAWRCIEEPGFRPTTDPIDVWGIVLLVIAMASLQYVLEEGNRADWWESPAIVALSLVAALSLLTLIVHELEEPHPVVDLRIFGNRGYACASALNFLVGVAGLSAAYLFSLYCGAALHYAAVDIGRVFLAAGIVQVLLMPLIGIYGAKVDGRKLIGFGVVVTCTGLWLHGQLTLRAGFWDLVWPRFVLSVGLAFLFVPLAANGLSDLPPSRRGMAAGLFNLTRELGGSIGTAWMSVTLHNRGVLHGARLAEQVSSYRQLLPGLEEQVRQLAHGAAGRLLDARAGATAFLQLRLESHALGLAFNDAFLLVAGAFACGLLLVPLLRRGGD